MVVRFLYSLHRTPRPVSMEYQTTDIPQGHPNRLSCVHSEAPNFKTVQVMALPFYLGKTVSHPMVLTTLLSIRIDEKLLISLIEWDIPVI